MSARIAGFLQNKETVGEESNLHSEEVVEQLNTSVVIRWLSELLKGKESEVV